MTVSASLSKTASDTSCELSRACAGIHAQEGIIKEMNITDVRVRRVSREGKMKAVVSITINDEFVVHDIKVIEGEKGLFIAMPSRRAADGEYRDIAHPINSQTRSEIQELILSRYAETSAEGEEEIDPEDF